MQKVSLLLQILRPTLLLLNLLGLLVLLLLHSNVVIPNALNGFFQVIYLGILGCVIAIFLVQLSNQLPQLKLLPLHKDVVALEILVLLLRQHQVESVVQIGYLVINLLLVLQHL